MFTGVRVVIATVTASFLCCACVPWIRQAAAWTGSIDGAGTCFDLQELYAAMKHPSTEAQAESHPALKPRLRPYQLRAAKWMQQREDDAGTRSPQLHPLLQHMTCACGTTLYYSEWTGLIATEPTHYSDEVRGGVLCDEMGLGKTVELLHLVLSRPQERSGPATAGDMLLPSEETPAEDEHALCDGGASLEGGDAGGGRKRPGPPACTPPNKQMRLCPDLEENNTFGSARVPVVVEDDGVDDEGRAPGEGRMAAQAGGGSSDEPEAWPQLGAVVEAWSREEGDWFEARVKAIRHLPAPARYSALPSVATWFRPASSCGRVKREAETSLGGRLSSLPGQSAPSIEVIPFSI